VAVISRIGNHSVRLSVGLEVGRLIRKDDQDRAAEDIALSVPIEERGINEGGGVVCLFSHNLPIGRVSQIAREGLPRKHA
jgi:hypothetical protein